MTQVPGATHGSSGPSERWTGSHWYILLLFTAIHVFLGVDRAILAVLAEPVKNEFQLTDTQLGILIGIGFSAFYCVAGLFLGWAVDRWNRRWILSICVAVFGAATAGAALAQNFVQLLISRLTVGAGEAGGSPAMVSMISDRFHESRRGFAMSVFYAGVPIGLLLNFLLGAYLAANYGWRTAFVAAGLPAVLLAILAFFTVREPPRRKLASGGSVTLRETLRHFRRQRSFWHILASVTLSSAALASLISFGASFLIRSHGLSLPQIGLVLAAALGVAGLIGAPIGGMLIDRLARRDFRWRAWFCALSITLSWAGASFSLLAPTTALAIAGLIVWGFFANAIYGAQMASFQTVVGQPTRGVATAVYYLLGQLVGSGGGATLAGILSDALMPRFGDESLRYALLIMMLFMVWAAVHWLFAARSMERDSRAAAQAFDMETNAPIAQLP